MITHYNLNIINKYHLLINYLKIKYHYQIMDQLPIEIIQEILNNVGNIKDQTNLFQICRLFNDKLNIYYFDAGIYHFMINDEILEKYPLLIANDRRNTLIVNYKSKKMEVIEHRSLVGITFDHSGKYFAILGGINNKDLTGIDKQHYWTVNVFSFEPF